VWLIEFFSCLVCCSALWSPGPARLDFPFHALAGSEAAEPLRSSVARVGFWPHPEVAPGATCSPLKRCARRFLASPWSRARSNLFSCLWAERQSSLVLFSCRRIQLRRIPFCRSAFAIPRAARFWSPASAPGVRASSSFQFLLEGPPFLNFDSHVLVKFCVGGLLVLFFSYRIKKLEFS
jgi:hypothetical protein